MERPRPNPDDPDKDIPELEQLYPGEIDLTGVVEQDDALQDVIGDAIAEAESSRGEVPDWGARTIARALANRLGVPGALHHYAATGNVHLPGMASELLYLYSFDDDEITRWVNLLGAYLASQANRSVGPQTPTSSAEATPTAQDALPPADIPQVALGIQAHGDAFRAYLTLPDVDPTRPGLLKAFQDVYIGSFTSIRELLDELTDLKQGVAAVTEAAEGWGFEGFVTLNEAALTEMARNTWDIIEYQGRLYVFTK